MLFDARSSYSKEGLNQLKGLPYCSYLCVWLINTDSTVKSVTNQTIIATFHSYQPIRHFVFHSIVYSADCQFSAVSS